MKTGKTLEEMARELDRQSKAKRDFTAPTTELEMVPTNERMELRVNGYGAFGVNKVAHEQIGSRLQIPRAYYDRLEANHPELLAHNVNVLFKKEPERRMVRTLDGSARAFLSERYRPLDNFDLGEVAFDTLIKNGVRVESTELTERRLYIKAVTDKLTMEVKRGDVVQAGIVISNSEVGCGSVKVEPMVWRLVCTNGLISADHAMRKYHVGRAGAEGDLASEFFKDETRQADDKAFWLKVRDVINGAFNEATFQKIVQRMQFAAGEKITGSIEGAIEITQEKLGLNDTERHSVLRHLIEGGDLTQWGLVNAVTRSAEDARDYDRATELERLGGVVLELPRKDWAAIAEAKAA